VDEARAVLDRLEKIALLERAGAGRAELLEELRALLGEAEAWSRTEGGDVGGHAVARLRESLARDMIAV
jgi:hypothetical protein